MAAGVALVHGLLALKLRSQGQAGLVSGASGVWLLAAAAPPAPAAVTAALLQSALHPRTSLSHSSAAAAATLCAACLQAAAAAATTGQQVLVWLLAVLSPALFSRLRPLLYAFSVTFPAVSSHCSTTARWRPLLATHNDEWAHGWVAPRHAVSTHMLTLRPPTPLTLRAKLDWQTRCALHPGACGHSASSKQQHGMRQQSPVVMPAFCAVLPQ